MSGHADSPGGNQNIPYVFKNLSKSINFLEHLQMTRIHVKIYFDQVKIIFQNQFRNTQKTSDDLMRCVQKLRLAIDMD